MELDIFTREAFEYFSEKIYGKHEYTLTRSKKAASLFKQFIGYQQAKYGASVGPEFIWIYLTYQFARFQIVDFKPDTPIGRVIPSAVFGKTALDKFSKRKQELDWMTLKSEFLSTFKITKDEFSVKRKATFKGDRIPINIKQQVLDRDSRPDTSKKNAVRTEEPLDICIDMNDLYNHIDPSCTICKDSVKCKQTLKETYPKIFKIRGYE